MVGRDEGKLTSIDLEIHIRFFTFEEIKRLKMDSISLPFTNEELNQLMIDMTRSFNDFSEDIAKGRIEELAPPFESYRDFNGDIISYCSYFFDVYNKHLSELSDEDLKNACMMMTSIVEQQSGDKIAFDLKKEVRAVEEMIIDTLVQYFKGLPSEAVSRFEKVMTANNMHLFYLIPQLSIAYGFFYRVRKDNGKPISAGKELFHVPFELRKLCGTYRYSILGYPSLYLAERLSIAKLETDIPGGKPYYAACFKSKRELRFIDLALGASFETIWDKYCLLVFYPLIMACGLKVKDPDAPFKPEYVLPQVMAQVFRLHENGVFDGFSYVSTKVDKPDYMDINMRNYVMWIKGADEEKGYSKSLADSFSVSGPIKCSGDMLTDDIEKELRSSPFLPIIDDN